MGNNNAIFSLLLTPNFQRWQRRYNTYCLTCGLIKSLSEAQYASKRQFSLLINPHIKLSVLFLLYHRWRFGVRDSEKITLLLPLEVPGLEEEGEIAILLLLQKVPSLVTAVRSFSRRRLMQTLNADVAATAAMPQSERALQTAKPMAR